MIEPIMYFGIGFLVAALLGLLFVPLVHNRAVRLTMRRLEAATPLSIAEIRADKDQLRAEFAMSTRRLEMTVEQMKTRTTGQLAELGKKTDAINHLKKELGEKTAAIFALEARDKAMRDQLRATEQEFELKAGSLRDAEQALADKEAELGKLLAELGDRSISADSQRVELAAMRTQVEALKVSVDDYERAVRETEERLARERNEAAARPRTGSGARQARQPRAAHRRARTPTRGADGRSRSSQPPRAGTGSAARRPGPRARRARVSDRAAARRTRNRRATPKAICAASSTPPAAAILDGRQVPRRHRRARSPARRGDRGALQAAARDRHHEARGGDQLGRRARRERAVARAHQRRRRRSGAAHRRARRSRLADRGHARRRGRLAPGQGKVWAPPPTAAPA